MSHIPKSIECYYKSPELYKYFYEGQDCLRYLSLMMDIVPLVPEAFRPFHNKVMSSVRARIKRLIDGVADKFNGGKYANL